MSEWISVTDRLPELGVNVLVFKPPTVHIMHYEGIASNGDIKWRDQFVSLGGFWGWVTHWMPLPALPERTGAEL